jgi:surface polysaccharide O-acyltransferase-like enzyme
MRGNRKTDSSIEFFRIIGCLMVIAVHLHLDCWVNGLPDQSRIFLTCLCCDGVGVFWFICGAFLFQNQDYKKVLRHTWKKVVVPMIVFSIFVFYLRGFLLDSLSLKESICHSVKDYKAILDGILGWYNPVEGIGHLWYLYVYILIMICFPILKYLVTEIDKSRKRKITAVAVICVLFLINDITDNGTLEFSHLFVSPASA